MEILFSNDAIFSPTRFAVEEPLFLNPDGVRTTFPIGWEGKGRYVANSLRLYRASDNSEIDPAIYHEENDRINFTFNSAPASGNYTDIKVRYLVDPEDHAFSTGSTDSAYPGEEYFLFPNWNNAKGCGKAFWVGKYAASNENGVPVSRKNTRSWVNTAWQDEVNSCLTKGEGFHCIRNREWVSIALWTEKMGLNVYGNFFGYTDQNNIDGQGTAITSAMVDSTDVNHKILTGSGPATFRHNGRIDGISDMAGNVWEAVDGIKLINGVVHVLDSDNTTYVALPSGSITSNEYTSSAGTINFINNSTNDLLNEGLPVDSAGMVVNGNDILWKNNTGTRICYRGGACANNTGVGMWALSLDSTLNNNDWLLAFVWLARVQLLSCLFNNITSNKGRWLHKQPRLKYCIIL